MIAMPTAISSSAISTRREPAILDRVTERLDKLDDAVEEQEDADHHGQGGQAVAGLDHEDRARHKAGDADGHRQQPGPARFDRIPLRDRGAYRHHSSASMS